MKASHSQVRTTCVFASNNNDQIFALWKSSCHIFLYVSFLASFHCPLGNIVHEKIFNLIEESNSFKTNATYLLGRPFSFENEKKLVAKQDTCEKWEAGDSTRITSSANCHLYDKDTNVLLENTSFVIVIRNHIRDCSGLFSISSIVKISITSPISSLALKTVFRFVGVSSKHVRVFIESLRQSSEEFNNVRVNFGQVL